MPSVLRIGPYVFHFYSLENGEPPHVHVRRDRSEAKFWLEPIGLHRAAGFRSHELNRIDKLVREHRDYLREAWSDYFSESKSR